MTGQKTTIPDDFLTALQSLHSDTRWLGDWETNTATFDRNWAFLNDVDTLRGAAEFLHFPIELTDHLARQLPNIAPWGPLIWHCHRTLTTAALPSAEEHTWPDIPESVRAALGATGPATGPAANTTADLLYIYVCLSCVDSIRSFHASVGVTEEISRDTLSDVLLWIEDFRAKTGRWGLKEQSWLTTHFSGRIFKLGRLQFEMQQYRHPYRAVRHRRSGRIEILTESGTDSPPPEFSSDGWDQILAPGDPTLFVHIPATGPMDPEACDDSFARALPFFAQQFPEFKPKAFQCSSWLLDPQLADHLPPESNIVRFLGRWRLTPEPDATDRQTIERVFGEVGTDRSEWPRQTSLQRAMLDHMASGGEWKMGAGLIFL